MWFRGFKLSFILPKIYKIPSNPVKNQILTTLSYYGRNELVRKFMVNRRKKSEKGFLKSTLNI